MSALSVLIKPASGMCNMSCDYCFYCDEMAKRQEESKGYMSEQTLKNVIRKTILCATSSITYAFQGGEPTIRGLDFFRRAVEYQKHYNKNGVRVLNVIQTNGYALDEEWCRFFAENNFLVGISVDGTKEIHDSLRHTKTGQGTYDKVLEATRLLDRYHVEYNILTVVTKYVAENITQIYREYQQKGWRYQQYIACLDPYEEERGQTDFALHPDTYGHFLIELFELWSQDVKAKCQPYIRDFENYAGILFGHQPESCAQKGICSVQNVVEADGSVYPCDFYAMDRYLLGNFNTDRLIHIQENAKKSGFIEQSEHLSEECRKCRYYPVCRGGCQRNRNEIGQSGIYHNYFCHSYQMFFDECLDKIKDLL